MKKKITTRVFFLLTLVCFLLVERQLKLMTGINSVLDMKIYYDLATIKQFFNVLGDRGRSMYRTLHIVDYLFILGLGLMQLNILKERLRESNINLKIGRWIFFLPVFLRGISDVFENLLIDIMLTIYPDVSISIAKIASFITVLKWVFLILFVIEICYLLVVNIYINNSKLSIESK